MPKTTSRRPRTTHSRKSKTTSTKAGEYVRDEIDKVRAGKHGVRNTKQAIAIGLSKARRAGVKLPPPEKGKTSEKTRQKAKQDLKAGSSGTPRRTSAKRSRATVRALKKESTKPVSRAALSKQAKTAARKRTPSEHSASAQKAARTRAAKS
jgi:hypothetical protein